MIVYTITLKRPNQDVPWLIAPTEAQEVIKTYLQTGKLLHQEIIHHDNLTASNTYIWKDEQSLDEFKNEPVYQEFVKYHNDVHCVKYGIELTRTIEPI